MKLFKPCYMIRNVKEDRILPPMKLFNTWFRGYYSTRSAAEKAITIIQRRIKEGWIQPADLKVVEVKEVL